MADYPFRRLRLETGPNLNLEQVKETWKLSVAEWKKQDLSVRWGQMN